MAVNKTDLGATKLRVCTVILGFPEKNMYYIITYPYNRSEGAYVFSYLSKRKTEGSCTFMASSPFFISAF